MKAPELIPQKQPLVDQQQQQARGSALFDLGLFGGTICKPGDVLAEIAKQDNALLLLAGLHGGMAIGKPGTLLQGVPGAQIGRKVAIAADCRIVGIDFVRGDNSADRLIDITATTATVVFVNCRFIKRLGDGGSYVRLANGTKASFIGCVFGPAGMTAGSVVENLGAAANCGIIGCSNKTGRAHVAVTSIFETV